MPLREKLKSWAEGPWAYPVAGFLGFLEGSFVISPVEPLLVPMLASRRAYAWLLAMCPVAGNVLAGLLMYALGATLAEPVIEPFVAWIGAEQDFADALERLRQHGFLALFLVGVTPIPFQIGTAAAGVAGYPLGLFVLAVAVSRSIRYLVLAAIVAVIGARAHKWIERYQLEIFIGGLVLFAGLTAALFLF